MTRGKSTDTTSSCDQKDTSNAPAKQVGLIKALLIGMCGSALIVLTLVTLTGVIGGRSPAERAATSLAMPVATLWLFVFAFAIANLLRGHRMSATVLLAVWLFVGVTFNGRFASAFLRSMEHPEASNSMIGAESPLTQSPLQAVVLLGGYAGENRYGVPELGIDGQRLMLAAQLWYAGKTRTIICTGTGAEGGSDPSRIGRQMLVSIGVPDDVIFEVPGLNTAGEMQSLDAFFRDPPKSWLGKIGSRGAGEGQDNVSGERGFRPSKETVGLVTTAVHLARAMRLAETHELEFLALGTNFSGAKAETFSARDLIPTAAGGKTFGIALKEWLAAWVGR
ncbi:MAG: YdcF family protein [Planctomycetales bacterium]|nr:YdcF family protein [Planctomycetales bacterium]